MLEAGARAPEFQLQSLGGGKVTLEEMLATAPVLVAFFKISCPVCQLTFPFLDRISTSLRVYGISQNDAQDTGAFNKRLHVTFPTLLDAEESGYPASNAYGISSVPSLFLIERDGTISWSLSGFSRKEIIALGARFGVNPVGAGDHAPEWQAG